MGNSTDIKLFEQSNPVKEVKSSIPNKLLIPFDEINKNISGEPEVRRYYLCQKCLFKLVNYC